MIYKKIKKSKEDNLLKMNAFEAANAGSSKFDLRSKEEKDKTVNVKSTEASNPITKSALRKNGDPDDYKYLMDANFNSMGGRLLNRNRYLEGVNLPELSQAKKFEDSSGSPAYDKFLKDKFKSGYSIQQLVDKDYGDLPGLTNLLKGMTQGTPSGGGSVEQFKFEPNKIDIPASQQFNMGEAMVEDANTARGRIRRGLNREERKMLKDRVQKARVTDPKAAKKYKDQMKESRKGTFLGLGLGGDRQERKIQSLKKAGLLNEDYQSYKSQIGDELSKMGSEERKQKIENATMNRYGNPVNTFGDFKPASKGIAGPISGARNITEKDLKDVARNPDGTVMSPRQRKAAGLPKMKQYKKKFGKGAGYNI